MIVLFILYDRNEIVNAVTARGEEDTIHPSPPLWTGNESNTDKNRPMARDAFEYESPVRGIQYDISCLYIILLLKQACECSRKKKNSRVDYGVIDIFLSVIIAAWRTVRTETFWGSSYSTFVISSVQLCVCAPSYLLEIQTSVRVIHCYVIYVCTSRTNIICIK